MSPKRILRKASKAEYQITSQISTDEIEGGQASTSHELPQDNSAHEREEGELEFMERREERSPLPVASDSEKKNPLSAVAPMRVDKKSLPPEYLQFLVQEPRTGGMFEDKMTQEEFDNIPQNCTPVDSDLSEEERERRSKRGRLYDSDVEDGDLYDHSTDRDDDKKSETVGGAAPKTKKHKKVKNTLKKQKNFQKF